MARPYKSIRPTKIVVETDWDGDKRLDISLRWKRISFEIQKPDKYIETRILLSLSEAECVVDAMNKYIAELKERNNGA